MGTFLDPENLKERTDSPLLKRLEVDDLDDRFIIPAERMIERAFALDLDTDNVPSSWVSAFAAQPGLQVNFEADYRRATILYVNRMADNPYAYQSRTVDGASVVYPAGHMPEEVAAIMGQWSPLSDSGTSGRVRRG